MTDSVTYFGQIKDPFLLNINPPKINKNEINLNDKYKKLEDVYRQALNSQPKNEISALKQYIQKMNEQIRLQLRMEVLPSLEEKLVEYSKKIKNEKDLNEKCYDSINDWLNRILNVDYIDPLVTLYDRYIKCLEEELKNSKKMNQKYENTITKLVNENNDLRSQLLVNEEEMKNFLGVRNEGGDGSGLLVTDRDYILKLEERNQLLSKENEILYINYSKIQNELMQVKRGNNYNNYNDKNENDMKYNKLYQKYLLTEKKNKELQDQYNAIYKHQKDFENDYYALQNKNENILDENKNMRNNVAAIDQILNNQNKF
jgi:hypothetical protein